MTALLIRRGYRQTFTLTIRETIVGDVRLRITPPSGAPIRISSVPGPMGEVLSLSTVTEGAATHTVVSVLLTPAATRLLHEGAVNRVECESRPLQEPLGEFLIEGSAGLNDDA